MSRNFLLEAKLKEAAAAAGALQSALSDFEDDVSAYRITAESEIPQFIEQCKKEKPHRFAVQSDHDAALCVQAFVTGNLTAQGKLFNAVGEARFNELKKLYADGVPESEKKRTGSPDHAKNPWAPTPANIKPNGRFTEDAVSRQMSLVRAIGAEKAGDIASRVGCRLGDLYAAGFKSKVA